MLRVPKVYLDSVSTTPVNPEILKTYEKLKSNKIIELNIGMIEALSTAIEFRNGESGEHVRRIYEITKYIFINTSLKADLKEEDIENILDEYNMELQGRGIIKAVNKYLLKRVKT